MIDNWNRMKNVKYIKDPEFFFDKIKRKEPFALVRIGDRQVGTFILGMGKWSKIDFDKSASDDFIDTLIYKADNYYIGLLFRWIKYYPLWIKVCLSLVRQDEKYLTSAHIFSALDWPTYTPQFAFTDWFLDLVESNTIKINWICNQYIAGLSPKFINKFFIIDGVCWRKQIPRCDETKLEILNYIDKVEDELFMFSGANFGNSIIREAWKRNKKNIYIDIGRVLDPLYVPTYEKKGIITKEYKKRIERWERLK